MQHPYILADGSYLLVIHRTVVSALNLHLIYPSKHLYVTLIPLCKEDFFAVLRRMLLYPSLSINI